MWKKKKEKGENRRVKKERKILSMRKRWYRSKNIDVRKRLEKESEEKLRKEKELAKPPAFFYDKYFYVNLRSLIVQKYIENPLLIEGKKLDMRFYLYVASFNPIYAVYYPGYLRRSILNY